MDVAYAYAVVAAAVPYEIKAFYGPAEGKGLGAGLLYSNVLQPAYDEYAGEFVNVAGDAYIITHECDIDQGNDRPFNDSVLICPIIHFDHFVEQVATFSNPTGWLTDLAKRNIPRLVYIPTCDGLPYGGVLYLNQITSTHVDVFGEHGAQPMSVVSATGLREVDTALQNLLMREKADVLYGMSGAVP